MGGMGISPEFQAELDQVAANMDAAAKVDKRHKVCACGHPVGKHGDDRGRPLCNALRATCPCREVRPVLLSPNTRIFCFKTDANGPALLKGWGKAIEKGMGERVEWNVTCEDCDQMPVTIVALEGGKCNEPRCGVHR